MAAVDAAQPDVIELHCACGARRVVPAGLRVVSCVKCGLAMGPPLPEPGPRPAIFLLVTGTVATQLVSVLVLGLAIAWAARRFDASSELLAWPIVSVLGIFAAGWAYRGSIGALLLAAILDGGIVAMRLPGRDRIAELLHASGAVPYVHDDTEPLALGIVVLAGVACVACLIAVPQARRFAAWQRSQIELAFRTRRV